MNIHRLSVRLTIFLLAGSVSLLAGCKADLPPLPPIPMPCIPGCAGNVLTYCDDNGAAQTEDCNAQIDMTGKAATCAFIEDENDYFCIGDFNGGCGDETIEGRCDGTKLIRCQSEDTGDDEETPVNVEMIDCANDPSGRTACAVAPDGLAGCTLPGTTGCGAVPEDGVCDGLVLRRCVNSSVQVTDCGASGKRCGLLADNTGFGCINSAVYKTAPGNITTAVSGTVVFEKRTIDTSSFSAASKGFAKTPSLTPVRRAQVQLIAQDGSEIQRSFTDENGAFTLYLPNVATTATLIVSASADPALYPLSVRDCPPSPTGQFPAGCTDGEGDVYQFSSNQFTGPTDLGQLVITEASGLGGAFNIFDITLRGQDFARVNLNGGAFPATPPVTIEWKKGFETITSYYNGQEIVVQGVATDTDEYDDPVLMHEFGHFLQKAFSQSDSPGGSHNGSPTDPRLAFGEGYGTYVGSRIAGSSIYYDSGASGITVMDVNNVGVRADGNDPRGIKQTLSEYVVSEILWRLDLGTGGTTTGSGASGGIGSAPIFDVLSDYFKNNAKYNDEHGVNGRELVKFIDGLFCRNYQSVAADRAAVIQQVVTTDHSFPYDDYTHQLTAVGSCK